MSKVNANVEKAQSVQATQAGSGKPLGSVVEFIAKAAEFAGLEGTIEMVLNKFPTLVHDGKQLTTVEEVEGALAGFSQFRRYFSERVVAKAEAAMGSEEYAELSSRINEARDALEKAKMEAKKFVEESVKPARLGDFAVWTEGGLSQVNGKKEVAGNSSGRGKRYAPRLQEYVIEKNGYGLRLYKEDNEWVVEVDGSEAARDASYTRATAEVWSEYFGLTSSMSVPREWHMREAEAAAGLPSVE